MIQNYHDGMAICRVFGAPDLFITFTCNPKWDEISVALLMEPGQTHPDRPDIVTRVFKMKINQFTSNVRKGKAFGPVNACTFLSFISAALHLLRFFSFVLLKRLPLSLLCTFRLNEVAV
jgi:hypothetical protein